MDLVPQLAEERWGVGAADDGELGPGADAHPASRHEAGLVLAVGGHEARPCITVTSTTVTSGSTMGRVMTACGASGTTVMARTRGSMGGPPALSA